MRIALLQCPPPPGDADAGLAAIADAAHAAAAGGADLLVTPEMGVTGYALGADRVTALARPRDGAYHAALADTCRAAGIAIAYGYPEAADGAVYNAAQLIGADGRTLLDYRKTHLFGDVDRSQFAPGDALSEVAELAGRRVALAICYDVEFPELVRSLALAGAGIVLTPTANMVPFDQVCTRIVPSRAYENGIGMVYANYVGDEADFTYCGQSCIVGPDGGDVARAGARGAALILGDMPGRARGDGMHMDDRRPDLYS